MKKLGFLAVLCLAGCATMDMGAMDWIAVGPEFSPTKPQQIEIVASAKEITRPYGNIGLLRVRNLKPDRDNLKMGVEKGKKFVSVEFLFASDREGLKKKLYLCTHIHL